jgi:hypothetical protein
MCRYRTVLKVEVFSAYIVAIHEFRNEKKALAYSTPSEVVVDFVYVKVPCP